VVFTCRQVFASKSATLHEEALMAVGALANGTFFPYLFSIFVPVFFIAVPSSGCLVAVMIPVLLALISMMITSPF
jgi:hypothetical protein